MSGCARTMGYRLGDTFSWATVNQVTLRTSAWTGSMTLSDPRRPDVVLVSNIAVTVQALNVNASDPSSTDYLVTLSATGAATMDWPVGTLRGVVTLRDGSAPQNVVSSRDFVVVGRA